MVELEHRLKVHVCNGLTSTNEVVLACCRIQGDSGPLKMLWWLYEHRYKIQALLRKCSVLEIEGANGKKGLAVRLHLHLPSVKVGILAVRLRLHLRLVKAGPITVKLRLHLRPMSMVKRNLDKRGKQWGLLEA
jgi:hypothetical protein